MPQQLEGLPPTSTPAFPRSSVKEFLHAGHHLDPAAARCLNGRVITPNDAAYDQARTVFCGGIDRHPAVIIRPTDATDVARVVELARDGPTWRT